MTNQEWLNFELIIADMVENIKDPEELSSMSEEIHEHVERALYDHAVDINFNLPYPASSFVDDTGHRHTGLSFKPYYSSYGRLWGKDK